MYLFNCYNIVISFSFLIFMFQWHIANTNGMYALKERDRKSRSAFRPVFCVVFFFISICGLILRLLFLQANRNLTAADVSERFVQVDSSRGYIYDRNLLPLVNDTAENTAVTLLPGADGGTAAARVAIRAFQPYGIKADTLKVKDACVLFETEKEIPQTETAVNIKRVVRYGTDNVCRHLIGYLDADGHGVCGIEKSFDRLLMESKGSVGVRYYADAEGRALIGKALRVDDRNYNDPAGVVLTIDRRLQKIADSAMKSAGIEKGAAVILDVADSAILASVSVPEYRLDDMERALTDPALPYLNRALEAYPVGSVFKPFVAAAAIDRSVSTDGVFRCEGSIGVDGEVFGCFQRNAHGEMDLNKAVCNSCNTYFIDLGSRVGAEALLSTARAFGFGSPIDLTGQIHCASGNLPEKDALSLPAALANFSFGQGDLLAAPLQLAAAYGALARGGAYKPPYLMKAVVNKELHETAYYLPESGQTAAQTSTCRRICESLRENMLSGTGVQGRSPYVTAAGKTATAQTGDFDENGKERLCTWFCGFFPYETPRYVVVVFNEDGSTAAEDCAPVFREISARICRAVPND